ncbi:TPA: hypothetical protein ACGAD2_002240 [Salmonella enterica subsp. enterica serovar Newport]
MNTEITTKHVQLARSGYYTRGLTNSSTILSIPNNKISKHAVVKYKGMRIGRIDGLYYSDLRDGRVELHGNITFTGSLTMLAEMVKDKALYPACVINTTAGPNQSWLSEVFFVTAEHREFDEQEPVNLKGLLNLVSLIAESEAPESATLFNKKCDNANSGLIGHISCNEESKIYLNETDTLEAKDGYLIVDAGKTKEAIRIDTINRMYSVQNNDNSESIFIYGHNGGTDIPRSTRLSTEDLIKFIEQYKESQIAELKAS